MKNDTGESMKSIKKMMDLHGRVALVTGGAGHIGSAICDALAEMGANIGGRGEESDDEVSSRTTG